MHLQTDFNTWFVSGRHSSNAVAMNGTQGDPSARYPHHTIAIPTLLLLFLFAAVARLPVVGMGFPAWLLPHRGVVSSSGRQGRKRDRFCSESDLRRSLMKRGTGWTDVAGSTELIGSVLSMGAVEFRGGCLRRLLQADTRHGALAAGLSVRPYPSSHAQPIWWWWCCFL